MTHPSWGSPSPSPQQQPHLRQPAPPGSQHRLHPQAHQALPQAASPVAHASYGPVPNLPAAHAEQASTPWRTIILWAVGILAVLGIGFGISLSVLIAMLETGGFAGAVVALIVMIPAAVSLLVITAVILVADRWDPQPLALLLSAVGWGAAFAVLISVIVNTFAGALLGSLFSTVVSAPLIEEITKGLGLVVALLLARRYFTGPLDGLVYGALIGGGFAFVENILYYTRFTVLGLVESGSLAGGAFGLVYIVFLRGILGIFAHVGFTSMTGVIMGWVARRWGLLPGVLSFLIAVIPGILVHASWNAAASLFSGPVMWFMHVLQVLCGGLWLVLAGFLAWEESRFTRARLQEYSTAGWLTPQEVTMLATWGGRRAARSWAAGIGQKPRMKQFIREATEVSHVRQQIRADGPQPKAVAAERKLLTSLGSHRAALQAASGHGARRR